MRGAEAKERPPPKQQKGDGQGESMARGGKEDLETDKRTHGAVDGVRSRGRRRRRRREGLRAGLQTGKLCRDRRGILCLGSGGKNPPEGNEPEPIEPQQVQWRRSAPSSSEPEQGTGQAISAATPPAPQRAALIYAGYISLAQICLPHPVLPAHPIPTLPLPRATELSLPSCHL